MDPQLKPVNYICGDCGQENTLKVGDVIQCRECGYHILSKKRTRRIVQYEARSDENAAMELLCPLKNSYSPVCIS